MKNKGLLQAGVTNVTSEAPLPSHVFKRSSTYYFRRVVPEALRPYFLTNTGKLRTEVMVSLGTKDRREAIRAAEVLAVEWSAKFAVAENKLQNGITPAASKANDDAAVFQERMQLEADEEFAPIAALENLAEEEGEERLIQNLSRPLETLSTEQAAMRRLLPQDRFLPNELLRKREAGREAARLKATQNIDASQLKRLLGGPSQKQQASVRSLIDKYLEVRKPAVSTIQRYRTVFDHFISHVGECEPASITAHSIRNWRDALLNEGLSSGRFRSVKTVRDSYLAAIKSVFNYAYEEGLIAEDPTAGVKVQARDSNRTRNRPDRSFTDEEVKIILAASLGVEHLASSNLSHENRLARRWVPWICAYTGARVNEITQLRQGDIMNKGGIWIIKITPDAGSTKTGMGREVPIHTHLIELGILTLAKAGSEKPIFYDPVRLRGAKAENRPYQKVGERLAAWVRSIGVTDSEVAPNHGWRHLFKTIGNSAGIPETAMNAIQGHAPRNEAERYGSWTVIALMSEIAKIPRFRTTEK